MLVIYTPNTHYFNKSMHLKKLTITPDETVHHSKCVPIFDKHISSIA